MNCDEHCALEKMMQISDGRRIFVPRRLSERNSTNRFIMNIRGKSLPDIGKLTCVRSIDEDILIKRYLLRYRSAHDLLMHLHNEGIGVDFLFQKVVERAQHDSVLGQQHWHFHSEGLSINQDGFVSTLQATCPKYSKWKIQNLFCSLNLSKSSVIPCHVIHTILSIVGLTEDSTPAEIMGTILRGASLELDYCKIYLNKNTKSSQGHQEMSTKVIPLVLATEERCMSQKDISHLELPISIVRECIQLICRTESDEEKINEALDEVVAGIEASIIRRNSLDRLLSSFFTKEVLLTTDQLCNFCARRCDESFKWNTILQSNVRQCLEIWHRIGKEGGGDTLDGGSSA